MSRNPQTSDMPIFRGELKRRCLSVSEKLVCGLKATLLALFMSLLSLNLIALDSYLLINSIHHISNT